MPGHHHRSIVIQQTPRALSHNVHGSALEILDQTRSPVSTEPSCDSYMPIEGWVSKHDRHLQLISPSVHKQNILTGKIRYEDVTWGSDPYLHTDSSVHLTRYCKGGPGNSRQLWLSHSIGAGHFDLQSNSHG